MIPKTKMDSVSQEPRFQIQRVSFQFLDHLDRLEGPYYQFYSGGVIYIGSEKEGGGFSVFPPKLHYIVRDDTVIPQNNYTLSILSQAYQLDWILQHLESVVGVAPRDLEQEQGKITIFHDTELNQLNSGEKIYHGNAAYISGSHAIATLKTTRREKIPVSSNLNVFAHEMGHLLLDHYWLSQTPSSINEEPEMKGIFEGVSDLIAYSFTGNSNILSGSFEMTESISQRDFSSPKFSYRTLSQCSLDFYCIGILFSHAFYQTQLDLGYDPMDPRDRAQSFKILWEGMKRAALTIGSIENRALYQLSLGSQTYTFYRSSLSLFLFTLLQEIKDTQFSTRFAARLSEDFGNAP